MRNSYVFVVTVLKNTTTETRFKISNALTGKITKLIIDIPNGWNYTTGVRITVGKKKSLPATSNDTENYFTGNDTDLFLNPDMDLKEEKLEIFGVNFDGINDHTCVVTVEVES